MVFYYDRNLTGTQGNDFLSTGAGEDILIGGDGDDLLRGGWGADHLYGGNDNDILIGENGDDHLDGQNGNDVLFGAYGTDVVSGGAGNDLFFAHASVTGLDGDIYDGDSGTDTLDYSYVDYTYGLTIDLSNTQGTATDSFYFTDYVIEIENIAATHQSDWITGSSSSNVFAGLEGDDIFYASSGKDVYHGGYTDAEMQNFWEHDLQDIDRINDGDEDTVNYLGMTGVAFEVTLIDAALKNYWVDKYYSGTLYSGTWDRDILFSIELLDIDIGYRHDAGGAVHMGDSGNNIMNYINLGGGNYNVPYSFYGYGGIDTLWGGVKNDLLVGGTGDDILSGNDGNDTYFYSLGDGNDNLNDGGTNGDIDTILFGFGINPWEVSLGRYHTDKMTITFADQSYITVDNQNSNGFGIDYIEFMDGTTWDMQGTLVTVYGTGGNDNLSGTTESAYREGSLIHDVIYAGGGNDYVNGHGGNDTIYGGDGNDVTLHGGYGEDVIYGEDGDDTINGGHDDDILYGGIGVDTINGGEDEDIIYGDAGNDILKGDNHDDIVYGGEGDDTINGGNGVDSLYGDADNDTINGDNGNDIIYGGGGNDTLIGGTADAGNDILVGDDGNDTLNGYNGADTLYGGAGIDTMTGGLGADTFMFESASAFSNIDTITDFKQSDNDKLDISDILEGYYNYGVDVITDFVQITQSGTTAYLSINQSGSGGGSYTQIATLTGLGTQNLTDEAALEASGRLITHVV
ncbi:MAG: type I secretion C-terminal target domain-containing protein [Alphaproteobacteria bacterium]|nr:type I secretion C-terminal target domain-containing protein [Alphaproteobacteria bacterium]